MKTRPAVSLICPLYNEEDNVPPLVDAVRRALDERLTWELILVDDGSEDATVERARAARSSDARVRLVRLARNYGQSTATQAGLDRARGDVVVTMDGDLQNDPADIPRMVEKLEEGYDLVVGFREDRRDVYVTRTLPSRVANGLIRLVTGVRIRDNGCALRAYRGPLARRLSLYSDMHRFVPVLAVGMSGARIAEVPVRHHARRFGESKYGLSRVWKVLADLLTVIMIRWFRHRPLQMFAVGSLGAAIAATLFVMAWALTQYQGGTGALVFPGSAVVLGGLAIYLFMVGLIAEVALHGHDLAEARPRGRLL